MEGPSSKGRGGEERKKGGKGMGGEMRKKEGKGKGEREGRKGMAGPIPNPLLRVWIRRTDRDNTEHTAVDIKAHIHLYELLWTCCWCAVLDLVFVQNGERRRFG